MAQSSFAQKLGKLFGLHKKQNTEFFEDLADTLIEGDIGAKTAFEITDILEKECNNQQINDESEIKHELRKLLLSYVRNTTLYASNNDTNIFMLLGVNGAGKTTTAAKLAK